MTCAFIDDGYTEEATLAEIPGVTPTIRFSFRPLTSGELGEFIHAIDKMTEVEARRETAKRMAAKIVDWDVRNSRGELVEIKAENIQRLKQPAFSGLWEIVQGRKSGASAQAESDAKN